MADPRAAHHASAHAAGRSGLPKFVVSEFEDYLDCGRLEAGCLRLECRSCGHSMLVAFSCKRRNWCPSCVARRMADIGVHLEQCVFPEAPVRHWICSLPWGLRALLGYDRQLCAEVLAAVIAELSRSLRRRAKKALGLSSVGDALTGAVTAVQRVDALAACYSAAALGVEVSGARAGQPALRLVQGDGAQATSDAPVADEPVAEVRGINLYGKQWIDGRDRKQLERLARYITRPPVAQERLSLRPDGTLLLEFKKVWNDGNCETCTSRSSTTTSSWVWTPTARTCAAFPIE